MEPITVVLIGAGMRGMIYTRHATDHPHELRVVGVADPDPDKRARCREVFGFDETHAYADWDALFAGPRIADAVFVCTQDRDHYEPALRALQAGYHVLLEKPMSPSWEECVALERQAAESDRLLAICHVLRYSPFFRTIKQAVTDGRIGRLMSIQHNENVGFLHYAHSYVRGKWRRSDESSPMILAKSCHDLDIMLWLADSPCRSVASYGGLSHFDETHAPPGAPTYCLDGCPVSDTCPYYAPNTYLRQEVGWMAASVSADTSYAARYAALRKGQYGRCVYRCDNDVVDHQVVSLDFANDVTASFTMSAFTAHTSRTLKLMGTEGELRATMASNEIEITRFGSGRRELVQLTDPGGHVGHGGGDARLVRDFVRAVRQYGSHDSLTSAAASVQSHLMAFAAERARLERRVVPLSEFTAPLN
ncbi:Gfo/Idh/MocA family oxidoreductase [Paenibacillus sp. IB182496]|uniref:Gfo/Idh/MocA family oxidoreductase n=1 Tax=Paenibacillus sabuli TaxID=2772509 RepID=A0A927BWP7_9BACL|nr:Gfo/Idh/MocA family oxidoreductase [Paenibacillus sabuli]MBD2847717.1 Gfo/Idh/MocA family oxidoreductase [Paenibacillus sabuli]